MSRRLRRLFRLATGRSHAESDAQDEVALHLALATDELIQQGVPPEEAARRALRAFGDERRILRQLTTIDQGRDRRLRWRERLSRWLGDARLALRGLRREPWFATSAVLLIGIAIGVNAVAFSVLDAALVRPLPYPDPDRLVWLEEMNRDGGSMAVAGRNLEDWQRLATDFEAVSALGSLQSVWRRDQASEFVQLSAVSRAFLTVVGLRPIRGRWFSPDESRRGGAPAAVVSERFWRARLGADPEVLGRVLRLDGLSYPIVGVMPAELDFPLRTEVWIPAEPWSETESRTAHNWEVVGRLRPGVSRDQAEASLSLLTRQLVADEPSEFAAHGALVTPLQAHLVGSSRQLLLVVQATVTLLLLVAALNLTSLLLARTARRGAEVAMTVALGARRADLVRRFVVESVLLATAGALLGLAVWVVARGPLLAVLVRELPFVTALPVSLHLIGYVAAVAAGVGLAAGLLPALWIARAVERGGVGLGRGVGGRVKAPDRVMRWLVGAEIATTFVLLFAAGLLGKSLSRLLDVDPGFEVAGRRLVTVRLPAGAGYERSGRAAGFYDRLREEAGRLPGVRAVGLTATLPLRDVGQNGSLEIQGDAGSATRRSAEFRVVSPGYFEALAIPLVEGRAFTREDGPEAPFVVVVNRAFARQETGGRAVGRVIRMPGMQTGTERWATIVGVVGDVRDRSLTGGVAPTVFYDYRQQSPGLRPVTLVVEADDAAGPVLDRLRALLSRLDPAVPFDGARFAEVLSTELATPVSGP